MFTSQFSLSSPGRDGSSTGAVDEEDFIQAFEDVPTVQVGLPVCNLWVSPISRIKTLLAGWAK